MGNSQSDIKHPFGSRNIPKHLKPLKKKKKSKKPGSSYNSSKENLPAAVAPLPAPPLPILLLNTSSIGDDAHLAGEETDFVGSGPRGAFRWFKCLRYLNHSEEVLYLGDSLPQIVMFMRKYRMAWTRIYCQTTSWS